MRLHRLPYVVEGLVEYMKLLEYCIVVFCDQAMFVNFLGRKKKKNNINARYIPLILLRQKSWF